MTKNVIIKTNKQQQNSQQQKQSRVEEQKWLTTVAGWGAAGG